MRSPSSPRRVVLLVLGVIACTDSLPAPGGDGLRVTVAPLSLPSVGKVCYDVEVRNGPDRTGDIVWSRGTPGLNGGSPDPGALCSSQFGNIGGGDIAYVGPCDADGQEDPSDAAGERTNSVTIWFDGLYDGGNAYVDPNGAQGWQNPCLDRDGHEIGCTLNVLCQENADALVEFNFTVMREANQGFFDVAVNFNDIFCSAKFDCAYAAEGVCSGPNGTCTTGTLVAGKAACDTHADCVVEDPIELLHDGQGERGRTFVLGFACTAGPGTDVDTELYLNDLELDCNSDDDPDTFTADFTLNTAGVIDGNQCEAGKVSECGVLTTGNEALDPDDFVYQLAVYRGDEALNDAATGAPLNKKFWNLALGVNPAIAGCRMRIAGTAEDANDPDDGAQDRVIAPGHVYPVIAWDVDAATCRQERASVAPSGGFFRNALAYTSGMIRLQYTAPTHTGYSFANALSATLPVSERCSISRPCAAGYRCTGAGECVHATTGAPQPYCTPWVNVFEAIVTPIASAAKEGKPPQDWRMLTDGRVGVKQFANTYASVYPTKLRAEAGEIVFDVGSETGSDDDIFGWTVNAQGTASTFGKAGEALMLFRWDRVDPLRTNGTQAVGRERGLRLYRVTGQATEGQLLKPSGPVQLVQGAATLGDSPWIPGQTYRVRMTYSTTRIRVWITPSSGLGPDGKPRYGTEPTTPEFDVDGTFPAGVLGFYTDSQLLVQFSVVSVAGQIAAPVGCGSAQDAACAGGAPAVITDIEPSGDQILFHYVLCGNRNPSDFGTASPACHIGGTAAWSNANASDPSPLERPLPEDFASFTSCTISFYGAETITTPPYPLTPTPCTGNPCLNGSCNVTGETGYTCTCDPGWEGPLCTLDIDGCAGVDCGDAMGCEDVAAPGVGHTCVACPNIPAGAGYGYSSNFVEGTSERSECQANGVPPGDPYLTSAKPDWDPTAYHGLDALRANPDFPDHRYYFPDTYAPEDAHIAAMVNDHASERVIFEDARTGAEVWLLKRNPDDEDVVYTNERRFNANGSLIKVGSYLPPQRAFLGVNVGNDPGIDANLMIHASGERLGAPDLGSDFLPANAIWNRSEPFLFSSDYPKRPTHRYLADVTGPVLPPLFAFPTLPDAPSGLVLDLSDDLRYLAAVSLHPPWSFNPPSDSPWNLELSTSESAAPGTPSFVDPPTLFPVVSASCPGVADKIGTTEFVSDQPSQLYPEGRLYLRYSLNKGAAELDPTATECTSAPFYQNWMVDVTLAAPQRQDYIRLSSQGVPLNGPQDVFLRSRSEVPSGGHGAISPSRDFQAIDNGKCKMIRDFRDPTKWSVYDLDVRMERCDHMDWVVDDNAFYLWARTNGTPIYRVETALDANNRLKARDVFRVVAPQACTTNYYTDVYQNTSPDGTKVLYGSNMLSDKGCPATGDDFSSKAMAYTRDLYMAIVERPRPPATLSLTHVGETIRLEWPVSARTKANLPVAPAPIRARETAGYHVYRSDTSGRGYVRLTETLVAQPASDAVVTWTDPAPGPASHYVVTTVDYAGVESRTYSPEAAVTWTGEVRVFWEAEEGELGPRTRTLFFPADASGHFAVARGIHDADRDLVQGSARATWRVSLPRTGSYGLWARARSRTGVTAAADVGAARRGSWTLTVNNAAWSWVRVETGGVVSLDEGPILVWLEATDSAVEVDAFAWVTDPNPTPASFDRRPAFTGSAISWDAAWTEHITGELASGNARALTASWTDSYKDEHCSSHSAITKPPVVCYRVGISGTAAFLEWNAFGTTTHHYQVYRRKDAAPDTTAMYLVGSPSKPRFVDPNLPAGTYHYVVQAVDAWGQASSRSPPHIVLVP